MLQKKYKWVVTSNHAKAKSLKIDSTFSAIWIMWPEKNKKFRFPGIKVENLND